MGEWQRGIVTPEQATEYAEISLRGRPAPDLDCAAWIKSDQLDWTKLRGKYVLLDFWFIQCGPCQADLPIVKMAHELYHDKGLVVIAVHNNNSPPDAVRKHAAEKGLPFRIAVDNSDGRTVLKFQSKKLVSGFPSGILIDPKGNVALDDQTRFHPTRRSYKLEIIRKLLFSKTAAVNRAE